MTIVKRGTKGTALTYAEMDENIRDLYEDTTIDRVLGNGNTTSKDLTVKSLIADSIIVDGILGGFGFTGSQGYAGSQGPAGGFTGSKGDIGFTGSKGTDGIIGVDGYTGSKGEIGYTGSQGVGFTGSKGDIGYTGSQGDQGIQGDIGYTGSKGDIGYTGSQGEIGYSGSQGIQGEVGYDGSKGDIRFTTDISPPVSAEIGDVWINTNTGIQYYYNYDGDSYQWVEFSNTGVVGFTGSQGDQGPSGGYTGSKGDIGYTGSEGFSGITWEIKTANFDATDNHGYFVNTTSGPITATLPVSATLGDEITFNDGNETFDTNNFTIARNGHKIQGREEDLTASIENAGFTLVYYNVEMGWKLKDK